MSRTRSIAFLCVAALALSACGSTKGERATTGAGIGAAGGAILGAVTGLTVVQGALIGAGVGGITGALTDEEDVNLGRPIWELGSDSDDSSGQQTAAAGNATVRAVQAGLADLGYDPGPVDGLAGPKTKAAIRQYQTDHGLLSDGAVTPELADHIRAQKGASASG
jgi:peptidoglycan hydrolase-like protein with peptidoglycan-binding domain